jgi:hypothetical protein
MDYHTELAQLERELGEPPMPPTPNIAALLFPLFIILLLLFGW